jgi:ABC-2 type transport system permease protein
MKWIRLLRAELRKLTTTKLPLGFLAVLVVVSAAVAAAVVVGAGTDDAGGFIDTADAQRSLLAFGTNAMMIGGLFGAIAVSREYTHGTAVPTFLIGPRRHRAMLAQFTVVLLAGGVLGFVGGALTVAAGAISLPLADSELLLSFAAMSRLAAASALAGATGAVLGAGIGAVIRNTGGAVTAAVVILLIGPPIVAQLMSDAAAWVPGTLISVISGVGEQPGMAAAIAALAAWGLIPAVIGIGAVQKRDVI